MVSNPLKAAKGRLSAIQHQIAALSIEQAELETTVKVLERMKSQRDTAPLDAHLDQAMANQRVEELDRPKRSRENRTIISQQVALLLADGIPRTTATIVKALKEKNIPIAGKNEGAYISQILSREKARFSADRKSGWSLRQGSVVVSLKSA